MIINTIAIGKSQACFTGKETTKGDLLPFSSVNANTVGFFLTAGEGAINQELETLEDKQVRNGRSKRNMIKGRFNPGKYSFPTYIKPLVPASATDYSKFTEVHHLLESVTGGTPVITAGDNVKFTLGNTLPTFNLFIKKDHTLFIGLGCTANQLKIDIKGSDVGMFNWEGEFMKMIYAGTSEITASAAASATQIVVEDAAKYNVVPQSGGGNTGAYIKIGTQADVYKITAVDYLTNTLTITPALVAAVEPADAVVPYMPIDTTTTAWVEKGTPVHGKLGQVKMGAAGATVDTGSGFPILDCAITITNNVKYSTDEKDGSMYAQDFFTSDFRTVEGTASLYFRTNDLKYWKMALAQDQKSLSVPIGEIAGQKFIIHLPHIEFKTPTVAGENEQTASIAFSGLMYSTVNDEVVLYYK